jgi:hypothetical protein
MKDLFQNLIWPAAAGNVAWAFFTVSLGEAYTNPNFARLAVLFLLAVYLASNWLRTRERSDFKPSYWIADAGHVLSIVVFAIAVQLNDLYGENWLICSLTIVFGVSIIGHLSGVLEEPGEKSWCKRLLLAGSNAVGPGLLFGSYLFFAQPFPYNLPVAVAAVLMAWYGVRIHTGNGWEFKSGK